MEFLYGRCVESDAADEGIGVTGIRPKRTTQQNNALHLYLERLADALNAAGYDMKKTLKHDVDIPWNKEMAKDFLWRPVQEALTGKESTADMDTHDPMQIYEVLSRHIGQKIGVFVEWPTE